MTEHEPQPGEFYQLDLPRPTLLEDVITEARATAIVQSAIGEIVEAITERSSEHWTLAPTRRRRRRVQRKISKRHGLAHYRHVEPVEHWFNHEIIPAIHRAQRELAISLAWRSIDLLPGWLYAGAE